MTIRVVVELLDYVHHLAAQEASRLIQQLDRSDSIVVFGDVEIIQQDLQDSSRALDIVVIVLPFRGASSAGAVKQKSR